MFKLGLSLLYLIFAIHFGYQAMKIIRLEIKGRNHFSLAPAIKKEIRQGKRSIYISMLLLVCLFLLLFFVKYG